MKALWSLYEASMKALSSLYEASINAAFRAPPKRAPACILLTLLRYLTYFTQVLTLEKSSSLAVPWRQPSASFFLFLFSIFSFFLFPFFCSALTTTRWVFRKRYSNYLLDWYKSTNTGTKGAARCGTRARAGVQKYKYWLSTNTGTQVQILTQKALLGVECVREQASSGVTICTCTCVLVLLVQEYKYWR